MIIIFILIMHYFIYFMSFKTKLCKMFGLRGVLVHFFKRNATFIKYNGIHIF